MPAQLQDNVPPRLFDRERLGHNLEKAWTGKPDFITQTVIDDLGFRLMPIVRSFSRALIMGPDARALPKSLMTPEGEIHFDRVATLVAADGVQKVDPEALELPHDGYDLIVSLLDLQVVNDVPGFLSRIRHHLKPDGLLLAASIGGRSLTELRSAWLNADARVSGGAFARVAPFMDVKDAGGLLQRAGYALPVTDVEIHRVRYADPLALMREIKAIGAANPMAETPTRMATPALLAEAMRAYADTAMDEDGRIGATLEILWLSGWAPHESQQKPLRPGSAKVSFAQVLKTKN